MTKPLRLLPHGSHVAAAYRPSRLQLGETPATKTKPDAYACIKIYRKDDAEGCIPQSIGWVKATYDRAIEYTGKTNNLRGLAFAAACFFSPISVFLGGLIATAPFTLSGHPLWAVALVSVMSMFGACITPFGLWMSAFLIRLDLFHASDQPIIFDRKHRRVYRMFNEPPDGLLTVFKPWPLRACAYEWDLIDARHEVESVVTGASVTTNHFLMFAVRKSATDATVIDSFQIANAMSLNDGLVDAMWEHIRRFMEESGPHLPTPNERLAEQTPPPNWWHSVGATGVFGPGYFDRWRESFSFMLLMHVIFPLTIPMHLLWGTGNWLSYKTEIPVDWPDEVKQAVGKAIRVG